MKNNILEIRFKNCIKIIRKGLKNRLLFYRIKLFAMENRTERAIQKAILICFKPYLKPDEAMLYCNLKRVQFLTRCREFGIQKNSSGYYSRDHLDKMLSGNYISLTQKLDDLLKGSQNPGSAWISAPGFLYFSKMIFDSNFFKTVHSLWTTSVNHL